jgi:hypothetical protein
MENTKLIVQTFDPEDGPDEDNPRVIGLRVEDSGLRLVLDDNGTDQEHDLLIERHEDRWLILLHANSGDPVLDIEITADRIEVEDNTGRTLLSVEVDPVVPMPEPHACDLCDEVYSECGDGYCGLCPECADRTDGDHYYQDCEYTGQYEDFNPTDGNRTPLVCPSCGHTNIFKQEE